jgi:uncharacterized membrane protein
MNGNVIDRRLGIAVAAVCTIGIALATYLTYVHYADLRVLCLSSGGCETVQSSRYATLDGVPFSVLGLAGYAGILLTLAVRGEAGRAAGFGLALVGCLFSLYLTYREIFTIRAICQWCLASAVLMTFLAIITMIRVLRIEPVPSRRMAALSLPVTRRRAAARPASRTTATPGDADSGPGARRPAVRRPT